MSFGVKCEVVTEVLKGNKEGFQAAAGVAAVVVMCVSTCSSR